jgi:hypothetical protein
MAAAGMEKWETAEGHFVEALRIAREFPLILDLPNIEFWHGKILLDRGRPEDNDRGHAMVESARDEYERRGMQRFLGMADELLAQVPL